MKYKRDKRSPIPSNENISRVMSANREKDTKPEIFIRKYLWKSGYKGYRKNLRKVKGCPDICFNSKKIAIFINGCFWHKCPYCHLHVPKVHREYWNKKFCKNTERDKRNKLFLESQGWHVYLVWECKIKKDLKNETKHLQSYINKFW